MAGGHRWDVVFDHYAPEDERRRETLLALGNGVLLVRATAPWAAADGTHYPGTYRAGLYDRLTDRIEGEEAANESVPNLPNWLPLTFRIADGEGWFRFGRMELLDYRHALDMRHGLTCRMLRLRDASGRITRLRELRLVSMARPHLAALRLELTPENWSGAVAFHGGIDGGVANTNVASDRRHDGRHLTEQQGERAAPGLLLLRARTRQSRIGIGIATRTTLEAGATFATSAALPFGIAESLGATAWEGEALAVEKVAAIRCDLDGAADEPGTAALAELRAAPGFAALAVEQAAAWAPLRASIGLRAARAPLDRALGFHGFHLLQTASPHAAAMDAGFPARGWQEAYRGQIFWEDCLVLPFLELRFPATARAALLYRWRRLEAARQAARLLGYRGAMFPWRSARDGSEQTPRFQFNDLSGGWTRDHTHLERHVGAAIAQAAWRYVLASGDEAFLEAHGAELILEIARFWASIARHDPSTGRYHIRGVVGPDEYHLRYPGAAQPGIDDNAYTNVMAARSLTLAPAVLERLSPARRAALCRQLRLGTEELAGWDHISRRIALPFRQDGTIDQFAGFERLRPFDIGGFMAAHPGQRVDHVLAARGDSVDAYAVAKQADLLMLPHTLPHGELQRLLAHLGHAMDDTLLRRTLEVHLPHHMHDSSLSRAACAGALARLDPARSWSFFRHMLRSDPEQAASSSTAEGAHLGAMACAIDVLQRHYLGLRVQADALALDPAPPSQLGPVRMRFRCRFGMFELHWSGEALRLCGAPDNVATALVRYQGEERRLAPGATLEFPVTA
ncbi:glycoside hydrolase family 65 protein [Teichococcus coralli]|nr:glycoside hydrolase family 65 protein [Pseudoroseomonas coralli]